MIKTTEMLLAELKNYANPTTKLARMVKQNKYFPIVKGLYETDRTTPPYLLAGSIYGPSYISFEYALSFYGLIPEAVYTVTSATFEKKKKKIYETAFGTFTYRDVPSNVFSLDIRLLQEGDYFYRIASAEKAVCDQLYTLSPVAGIKELAAILLDDLRIEETELKKLNLNKLEFLAENYRSTNVKKLAVLLRRMAK